MPDESLLREKARAVVQTGKLPARRPDRMWGGPGVGAACAICALPVTKNELEFEIQFARNGDNPGLDKYHLHVRCFAAWEFERGRGSGSITGEAKAKILVEVEPAAAQLLTDQAYQDSVQPWTPAHNALGPLRLAMQTAPDWSSDKGKIYRMFLRPEQAEELQCRCEEVAEILGTFPEENDRQNGVVLGRASRAFRDGLLLSE